MLRFSPLSNSLNRLRFIRLKGTIIIAFFLFRINSILFFTLFRNKFNFSIRRRAHVNAFYFYIHHRCSFIKFCDKNTKEKKRREKRKKNEIFTTLHGLLLTSIIDRVIIEIE